jgi:hypothetical protein
MTVMVFWSEIPGEKCLTMRYCHATVSSFVAKVWGKIFTHFHAVAIKHHNSMQK